MYKIYQFSCRNIVLKGVLEDSKNIHEFIEAVRNSQFIVIVIVIVIHNIFFKSNGIYQYYYFFFNVFYLFKCIDFCRIYLYLLYL